MDWQRMTIENTKRRLAELQASQTIEIDANTATTELIDVVYSCIPNVVHPWDPDVLKRIWTIDKDFRPLWMTFVYQTPSGQLIKVGRHGIARKVDPEVTKLADPSLVLMKDVKMPTMPCQGVTFDAPNFEPIQWYLNDGTSEGPHKGSYLPFTMEFYAWLRENYTVLSPKEFKQQFVRDVKERRREAGEKVRQENQHMQDELDRYVRKVLEHTSDVEIKETFKPYALGYFGPKDKKPFVHLGS